MLPSSPQVQTVYLESGGIVPALKSLDRGTASDTLCIDSTTLDVVVARKVAADVIGTGAHIVDAPVSGGKSSALHPGARRYFMPSPQVFLVRKPGR